MLCWIKKVQIEDSYAACLYVIAETVSLSRHLALQVSTRFAFGRSSRRLLLSLNELHDLVVNEVFDSVSESKDFKCYHINVAHSQPAFPFSFASSTC